MLCRLSAALACLALCFGSAAAADASLDARLNDIARAWSRVNFEDPDKTVQASDAKALVKTCDDLAQANPGRAEPLVWEALAEITEAGARRGLVGFGLVKSAKAHLERAQAINPNALGDGTIYTNLGLLYAQVPGFPIGFGDAGKARANFQKALAINPDGVEPNLFYADFLMHRHDYAAAAKALQKAIAAPPRPGHEVGDKARHDDALALQAEVNRRLSE